MSIPYDCHVILKAILISIGKNEKVREKGDNKHWRKRSVNQNHRKTIRCKVFSISQDMRNRKLFFFSRVFVVNILRFVNLYMCYFYIINNNRSSGFRSNHRSFIATVLFRMVRNCRTILIRQLQPFDSIQFCAIFIPTKIAKNGCTFFSMLHILG